MHLVRVLLDELPELLVEPGVLPGPGGAAADVHRCCFDGHGKVSYLRDLYAESGQTLQGSLSAAAAAVDRTIFKN